MWLKEYFLFDCLIVLLFYKCNITRLTMFVNGEVGRRGYRAAFHVKQLQCPLRYVEDESRE